MDIVYMNKKGFAIFEILAVILVLSFVGTISLSQVKTLNMDHLYFMNDYLLNQSASMKNYEPSSMDEGVSFNSMGRVRNACTIDFVNHKVIVHLGNGYVFYE